MAAQDGQPPSTAAAASTEQVGSDLHACPARTGSPGCSERALGCGQRVCMGMAVLPLCTCINNTHACTHGARMEAVGVIVRVRVCPCALAPAACGPLECAGWHRRQDRLQQARGAGARAACRAGAYVYMSCSSSSSSSSIRGSSSRGGSSTISSSSSSIRGSSNACQTHCHSPPPPLSQFGCSMLNQSIVER